MSTPRAVVIGSGAGGLASAAFLARDGFEVTVLERATQLGGYINPFQRRHYEFDPGVHYLGDCGPGGQIPRLLEDLGIDTTSFFARMDEDGFDVIRFPDVELRIPAGLDRFRDRLVGLFPAETRGIDRYVGYLDTVRRLQTVGGDFATRRVTLDTLRSLARGTALARWVRAPFAALLRHCTRDTKLQAVLAGQCGDYGLPPSRASALMGLAVAAHYADGAWFPRGGSRSLRDALVDAGKAAGATYHRFTEVVRVDVRDGRARGVETADGTYLEADVVVGAIEPQLLFGELVAADALPGRFRRKVERLEPSIASLSLFLGMERDLRDHGLGAFNIWDYPDWDIEALYRPALSGQIPEDWFVFLSPNSLKDDTGALAPEGCSTLEVVTFAPYEAFAEWDGQRALMRGETYRAKKEALADEVLDSVARRYPGLVGDVVVREVGTPVSNTYYANAVAGGAYGPAATPGQSIVFRFGTRTPVHGLLLAGSGVLGGGVSPALESGRLAAAQARRALGRAS